MTKPANVIASGHFDKVLSGARLKTVIDDCVNILRPIEFDTLAFIGLSGATVAPTLAYLMGKELLMVRKQGGKDGSNSSRWVEGNFAAERIVIVDDLTSSGRTMSQVVHAIRSLQKDVSPNVQIVGVLLHYYLEFRTPKDFSFGFLMDAEKRYMHPVTGKESDTSGLPLLYTPAITAGFSMET